MASTTLKALVLLLCALLAAAFVPAAHRQANAVHPKQQQQREQRLQMALPGSKAMASFGLLLGAATGLYAPQPSHAAASSFLNQRTETMIAKDTEVRQGMYKEYTVDKAGQQYENAEGTFKTKEATEGNKNKYVAILTVLLIGSAVIPMVQYYWYVKDD